MRMLCVATLVHCLRRLRRFEFPCLRSDRKGFSSHVRAWCVRTTAPSSDRTLPTAARDVLWTQDVKTCGSGLASCVYLRHQALHVDAGRDNASSRTVRPRGDVAPLLAVKLVQSGGPDRGQNPQTVIGGIRVEGVEDLL